MIASIFRTGLTLAAAVSLAQGGLAWGQEADQFDELKALYHQLVDRPQAIVTAEAGRDALFKLDELVLDETALEAEQLAQLLLCRIYALLAIGDAASLTPYMSELRSVQPDAAATHRAAHLVAAATGDGKLGVAALSAQARALDATAQRKMAASARRFKIVGSPAPSLTVKADNGADIEFGNRGGRAMILFLWNFRRAPSPEQIAAMRRIYAEHGSNGDVDIFGISANTLTLNGKAHGFARSKGLSWPHHFEQRGMGAPITHKAFKAGSTPAQIVIDMDGVVRAIGEMGAPAMEYATRAAVAEAGGAYPLPESRAANGKITQRGVDRTASASSRKTTRKKAAPLEDNRAAENLMQQARLMIRIRNRQNAKKLLQRIVREYPNTKQAKQALSMLDGMP